MEGRLPARRIVYERPLGVREPKVRVWVATGVLCIPEADAATGGAGELAAQSSDWPSTMARGAHVRECQ